MRAPMLSLKARRSGSSLRMAMIAEVSTIISAAFHARHTATHRHSGCPESAKMRSVERFHSVDQADVVGSAGVGLSQAVPSER